MLLFSATIGSHLYGLSHEGSDHDRIEVYEYHRHRVQHTINGEDDVVRCGLSQFLTYAGKGVPQFLEALYVRDPEVDKISYLRESFHPHYYQTIETYQRTIKSFYYGQTTKQVRHAYRLYLNLEEFREYGRFNPTININDLNKLMEQDILSTWITK